MIDEVMTINSVQKSSKSELSSRFFGHLKISASFFRGAAHLFLVVSFWMSFSLVKEILDMLICCVKVVIYAFFLTMAAGRPNVGTSGRPDVWTSFF